MANKYKYDDAMTLKEHRKLLRETEAPSFPETLAWGSAYYFRVNNAKSFTCFCVRKEHHGLVVTSVEDLLTQVQAGKVWIHPGKYMNPTSQRGPVR